jgi:molybdopterin converting factor small subunit
VASDLVSGSTVDEVVAAAGVAASRPAAVVAVATFLVDGSAASRDRAVPAGATVEVLPPFAGG